MKKLFTMFAIFVIAIIVVSLFGATPVKAAPAPSPVRLTAVTIPIDLGPNRTGICVIQPDGTKVCYEYSTPEYTDPTYGDCSGLGEGWEEDPDAQPPGSACRKWVEGGHFEYTPKVIDEAAHWGDCENGYEVDPGNVAVCRKLIKEPEWVCDKECPSVTFSASRRVIDVPGHYIYTDKILVVDVPGHWSCPYSGYHLEGTVCKKNNHPDKPAVWVDTTYKWGCPEGYDLHSGTCRQWVDTTYKTEVFGPITFAYEKSNDPNKCHRPTGESLGVPSWAMNDFNKLDEWLDCQDANCHWTKPVYDYKDRPWIDTTYACPEGWEEYAEGDNCRQWVDTSKYIGAPAPIIDGDPFCEVGELVGDKCRVEVPCPPDPCKYPGLEGIASTDPACKLVKPTCDIGWASYDWETDSYSCGVTNWDFCNYQTNDHCIRHLNKFAGDDNTQLVLLRYQSRTLADPNYPYYQAYQDRLVAK